MLKLAVGAVASPLCEIQAGETRGVTSTATLVTSTATLEAPTATLEISMGTLEAPTTTSSSRTSTTASTATLTKGALAGMYRGREGEFAHGQCPTRVQCADVY